MFEREIGYTTVDVRNYGALGNGVQDDTYAIACALRALGSGGGTAVLPPGDYLVDPLKAMNYPMPPNTALRWISGARMLAMPNDAERDTCILISAYQNELINPVIIGNREDGIGTSGEWGHCISIMGAEAVTVRGGNVSKAWGDGLSIGAMKGESYARPSRDIVLCEGFTSSGNRRNGLTIGRSDLVRVLDCTFGNTFGTDPEAGIDVEPDAPGSATNWRIERCKVFGNAKTGILVWQRTEPNLAIEYGVIQDCEIYNNGVGVWTFGANALKVFRNTIRHNRSHGLLIDRGTDGIEVSENRFAYNYMRQDVKAREAMHYAGQPTSQKDILVRQPVTGLNIGFNDYAVQVFTPAPVEATA